MINLIVGKIDKYIISLENVLNRLPNDELVVIPIDFDRLMELVIRGHSIELGRVLATLVSFDQSQRSGNYPWSAQEIELLIEHLETRLFHDSEWLDAIIENPEPLTVNYAYYRLLRGFSEDPEPFRLSVDHIQGQLSTFQQNRPDNTTKTLEYIQTLHRSREFLSRINSKNVILYNSNLTTVSETLAEIDFLLLTYHQDLEKEMFGMQADEDLARGMQQSEYSGRRPRDLKIEIERENHFQNCDCYICSPIEKQPIPNLFHVTMDRLKRWKIIAKYSPVAEGMFFNYLGTTPDALGAKIWESRNILMRQFPYNQFEIACFLLQHGPLKKIYRENSEIAFQHWLCHILSIAETDKVDQLMALVWASVSKPYLSSFIKTENEQANLLQISTKYYELRMGEL